MEDDDEIAWVTADGRELAMSDITDRHLGNIIAMLERSADDALACNFQGEQAAYEADKHIERCSEKALEFRRELERRKAS